MLLLVDLYDCKLIQMLPKWPLLLLILLYLGAAQTQKCERMNYLPMPVDLKCGTETLPLTDPCRIFFSVKVEEKDNEHVAELIQFQMSKSFNCSKPNYALSLTRPQKLAGFELVVDVQIKDSELKSVFTLKEESYKINISKQRASIQALTYVGFVRGLETLIQSVKCPRFSYTKCEMVNLPITIADEPSFVYRGLMIDTSRHYLPFHMILQTIDAMMYNKLNVLHWHIVDEDSFPLILDSHPEIAQYASYSPEQTYTADQAREIVKYGLRRGVRIVPELDTPGHAASWGLAPENKGVACTFGTGFMGPLDVTLDRTYKLVKQVFAEIFDIFPDPIVHLGGDEVVLTCFANKTEFLQKEGIREMEMQRHYRRKQHKILEELHPNKKFMYWMNTNEIHIEAGDIIHWWGGGLPATKHQIVISQYGPFYLDMGVGNYLGVSYGNYQTWMDLYNMYIGQMIENYQSKDKVLGAEVCLWSQLSNQYVHHHKIWIRSSAFAERVWTVKPYNPKPDVLGRIAAHEKLMNRRGIPTAGATSQQCETKPGYC